MEIRIINLKVLSGRKTYYVGKAIGDYRGYIIAPDVDDLGEGTGIYRDSEKHENEIIFQGSLEEAMEWTKEEAGGRNLQTPVKTFF